MTGSVHAVGRARPAWDPWLLGSTFVLLATGVIMVYSASVAYADREMNNSAYFLIRHASYTILGLVLMAFTMRTRVRWWEKAGPYLLLIGIVSLSVVLLPGIGAHVNGSSRWIRLGIVNLQPSEFMKLFAVVYVAGYLVRKQEALKNFTQGIVMVSVVVAVIGALLLMEPDMGSLVVITVTVFAMLFLGGVRFWHFMMVLGAGAGSMVLLTIISPYRMARATSFMDPFADPFNTGFQLVQALIAFGRGEWFGAGLGASVQKLFYLPAAHTDFVFAVMAEELGLVAVLAMMVLYGVIIVRAFIIARRAEAAGQIYGARLAQGIGLLLGGQAMINMGVNMGLLPTKGLTLPFVSYGGSSMLASCIAMGLLLLTGREAHGGNWGKQ
ncbi:MAG: putative lipid II flippase FtsW [Gammaproteobacteria bacterium]|nr:putative lipid II flippase FtsW [Gammaproteobacteria bacterium]